MITDEMREKLFNLFSTEIQGGTSDYLESILDKFMDDGNLSEDYVREHEYDIAVFFDTYWFTCEGCGWTLPQSEMAETGDWTCTSCEDEE